MPNLSPLGMASGIPASLSKKSTLEEYRDFENYAPKGSTYLSFASPWSLYENPHLGYPEYQATSRTTNVIGTGNKTFMVESGKRFAAGRRVVALINNQWTRNMEGDVVSYDNATGRLVIKIDPSRIGDGGTSSDWVLYQRAQQGIDYLNTIRVNPSTYPNGTLITSSWPEKLGIGIGGALGFNIISQGNYNNGVPAVATTPVRVNELAAATHNFRWTWISGDREKANVLDEWYVTTAAGDLSTKIAEVGFFLHAPQETIGFHSAGRQIGTYTDENSRTWKVAKQPTGDAGNFIMLIRTDHSDVTSSKLDLRRVMFWLVDKGEISGNTWLNGTAIGVEPLGGTTSVQFDTFQATQTKLASGTPGAILRLSVAAQTATSVTLAFEELADNVTGYQYRLNGGGKWTALPASKAISGLPANSMQTVEVRGVNGSKTGAASSPLQVQLGGTLNLIAPPADSTASEWTAVGMTDPTGGVQDSAGNSTASRSMETAEFGNHFREFVVSGLPTVAGDYWFRARIKSSGRDWAYLHVYAGTFQGDYRKHFNLATGELGATGGLGHDLAYVDSQIASAGNGYRDCAIRVTKAAGITSLYLRVGTADTDGNIYFTGDAKNGLIFDGTSGSFRLEAT